MPQTPRSDDRKAIKGQKNKDEKSANCKQPVSEVNDKWKQLAEGDENTLVENEDPNKQKDQMQEKNNEIADQWYLRQ